MFERRSLRLPITLGVVMIVLIVVLLVGWIILSVVGAWADQERTAFYWTFLAVGASVLVLILLGVVTYLTLSIKAINLNQRQSNFIDSVTHELKSPIASLKLYLQTLNRRSVSDEERAHFHEIMLEDVERLDELINQLLTTARIQKGLETDSESLIRIDDVIRKCVVDVCMRYRRPTSIVAMQLEPCSLFCHGVNLDLALRNLIDNAVKYSNDDDPRVAVTLRLLDQDAVVVIEDNGSGVPAAMRRQIFRRFVRLGVELEREKPGTGLGLHIAGTLLRQLKGQVHITDGQGGVGTRFELTFPGAQAADSDVNENTEPTVEPVESPAG